MNEGISFTVPGKPQGKARARTFYNPQLGRIQSTTPENTVLYENLVKMEFLKEQLLTGFTIIEKDNSCNVLISACYPIPKSYTKKQRQAIENNQLFPTKKPDADNIAKVILDALNGLAYVDDSQIVNLSVTKQYVDDSNGFVLVHIFNRGR